ATLCPGPVKTGFGAAVGISDEDAEAAMPKVMWVDAATVAKTAVDGMVAGRTVIVPGLANRIGAAANHLLPRGLLTRMVARSHPALKRGRKA
ncbi:MAG: SDR family NAD(P)-dependent oxidoreductase, partial [[Mycobacterium] stephanolepidis]